MDDQAELTETVFKNLGRIREWVQQPRDLAALQGNDDLMAVAVELMNRVLYVSRIAAALAPDPARADRGYNKHSAIIAGMLVRCNKLYEGATMHTAHRQFELASVFYRMVLETAVHARCLMARKQYSTHQFVLASYRPEKEILTDLRAKASRRRLTPIERRIRAKIRR